MAWRIVLEQGFTQAQKQTVSKGIWQSATAAYEYMLYNYFQQERRLFKKEQLSNTVNMVHTFIYTGVNDDGFSASFRITML